jgi:hypothetical protein
MKSRYCYERVVELSEDPLDPVLFIPPPDFKQSEPRNNGLGGRERVTVATSDSYTYHGDYLWTMRVRLNWLMLTDFERLSNLLP